MTRDVLARKLNRLRIYLSDLAPHVGRSADDIAEDPYEIERLLEVLVQVAVDVLGAAPPLRAGRLRPRS